MNLIPVMERMVEEYVKHWGDPDFKKDVEILKHAQKKGKERCFLWMLRECGTHLLPIADVFVKDSPANLIWTYYQDYEKIRSYIVEISAEQTGEGVMGTICEIPYRITCRQVEESSRLPEKVKVKLWSSSPPYEKMKGGNALELIIPYWTYTNNHARRRLLEKYEKEHLAATENIMPDDWNSKRIIASIKALANAVATKRSCC